MIELVLLVCLFSWLPPSVAVTDDLTETVSRARLASGFSALATGEAVVLSGEAEFLGLPADIVFTYAADGRFARSIEGELGRETVFDGDEVWKKDYSAGPYALELSGRESELLRAWVHSGYWLSPSAPLDISKAGPTGEGSGGVVLAAQLRGGKLMARVELDQESHLPRTLWVPDGAHELVVRFEGYGLAGEVQIANTVRSQLSLGHDLGVEAANSVVAAASATTFRRPAPRDDYFLDPTMDPAVEATMSSRKRVYVRPRVNGQDVGWFLFDSGAGFSGISKRAAKKLGLVPMGSTATTGLGGHVTKSNFVRSTSFQLGPLRIDGLVFSEVSDRSRVDTSLGEVNGVLGWDVLMRAVVELDPKEGKMSLFDFATYDGSDLTWLPVTLHYEVPWVTARFTGDREGLFMVDTGAGSAVYCFAAATRRLGLLDGQDIQESKSFGAGGEFSTTRAPMEWFEVAGDGWKDSMTVFGLGDDGEDDPYTVGLMGGGLLRLYRLVFDYSKKRVCFLPR